MKLLSKDGRNTELLIEDKTASFKGEPYDIVIHDGDVGSAGDISVNNLLVKEDYVESIIGRFSNRKGNVDKFDGFAGFMLLKKDNQISVLTGWKQTEDFTAWADSQAFKDSHVQKEKRVESKGSEYLEEMPVREHFSVQG